MSCVFWLMGGQLYEDFEIWHKEDSNALLKKCQDDYGTIMGAHFSHVLSGDIQCRKMHI